MSFLKNAGALLVAGLGISTVIGSLADLVALRKGATIPALAGLVIGGLMILWGVRAFRLKRPANDDAGSTDEQRNGLKGVTIALLSFVLVLGGATLWFKTANSDMHALTEQRRAALAQLRPALLRYKEQNGQFPARLEDLVPNFIPAISASLLERPDDEAVRRIVYAVRDGKASFRFHAHRGPDSTVEYDVGSGELRQNR